MAAAGGRRRGRPPPVPPAPRLEGVRHDVLELRTTDLRLHVASAGPHDGAPVVVLVPSWPQHWWAWRKVIPPLVAAGAAVHGLDPRGIGTSPAPPGAYATRTLAEDLIHVVDRLSAEPVVVAAHGWGAWQAWHAAARAPDRFARLVTLGSAVPRRAFDRVPGAGRAAAPLRGGRAIRDGSLARELLRAGTVARGARDPGDAEVFLAPLRDHERAHAAVRLHRTHLRRERGAGAPGLRGTHATRLVGDADPWVDARDADVIVPGAGHFLAEEAPDAVVAAILGV
jgi:pimeloyl-ACP methyl ester carboxylesterase